ncbi:MAG: hypothetical protein IE916_00605 [Epsilonproteobacteria bacterium]|nr:hypothetical protein [Campylobacterota bacterium]
MANHKDIERLYLNFIFNKQFNRKISFGKYGFTTKGFVLFVSSLSALMLNMVYGGYFFLSIAALLAGGFIYFYLKSKLTNETKLNLVDNNGIKDEKLNGILLFSKVSWGIYNGLKNRRKKRCYKDGI